MSIWFENYSLEEVEKRNQKTMLEHLDIRMENIGPESISGSMPVDHRTIQPHGLLHGGASVVLAESLASIAGNLIVDPKKQYCVGLEINANHIRPVKSGRVMGEATPIHIGGKTQVWQIQIVNQDKKLVCLSRMTLAVLDY